MAFIRKRVNSYQLIETYRDNGKVKQRVLLNLHGSPSFEAARQHVLECMEYWKPEGKWTVLAALSGDRERRAAYAAAYLEDWTAYLEKLDSVVSACGNNSLP